MRKLFVICAILVQLLGYISAEAKTAAPGIVDTKKESPLSLSSLFQHEHPADLTSPNHIASIPFKLRYQRIVPAIANWYDEVLPVPVFSCKHEVVYTSPLFLPLIRSLLYPNHYFW